jgi:hypothetical protein
MRILGLCLGVVLLGWLVLLGAGACWLVRAAGGL